MKILFCGGGTVGHISPSLAVAQRLQERFRDSRIAFVGRKDGGENEVIRAQGFSLYEIEAYPLLLRPSIKGARRILKTLFSHKEAYSVLDEFMPDALFATGGYVSYPMLAAARRRRIPTFIHESNAVAGLVTGLLAKKCTLCFVGMRGERNRLLRLKNAIYTGNPTRAAFHRADRENSRRILGIAKSTPLILSVGGSGGAMRINEAIMELSELMAKKMPGARIIHSSGRKYYADVMDKARQRGLAQFLDIKEFITDMPLYLSAADIVISRCGAMTLAEIGACGARAILIPSPNVAKNHQLENARAFCKGGSARIIEERELESEVLFSAICELLATEREAPSEKTKEKNPADAIIDGILRYL